MTTLNLRLSEIDKMRFGVTTAKADGVTFADLEMIDRFCRDEGVQFLIARVDANHLDAVQAMEADGYRLMDTLVYYAFKFGKKAIPEDTSAHVLRPALKLDTQQVTPIAEASFRGYKGHYHADPRLDNADCDAVYTSWATNSVTDPTFADAVVVVEKSGRLDGFATLRLNNPQESEGVLFGVAPHAQGQGIYRAMMIAGMHWGQAQQTERMVVSTQIINIAVQKVWARLGFEMDRAYYTFHKWFD